MCLVGGLLLNDSKGIIDFLIKTFPRLMSELDHPGGTARQVQYESGASDEDHLHFVGFQVDRIENIPEGMIAWVLGRDSWTVLQSKDGQNVVIWQDDLSWKWLDESTPGKPVGEFTAKCPAEWGSQEARNFTMFANSYKGIQENCDDEICLVDYDPSWPEQYDEMAQRLAKMLGPDVALRIEHYGSTAIPGISAKPVIDILVEIPSFEAAKKRAIPLFNRPECEYWFYAGHVYFMIREKFEGRRTHHIHMLTAGHRIWDGIKFRDYLSTHSEDASRYVALKYELAERYRTDREAYTDAKDEFVREILAKANAD